MTLILSKILLYRTYRKLQGQGLSYRHFFVSAISDVVLVKLDDRLFNLLLI